MAVSISTVVHSWPLPCLTVQQPHASAIARGDKFVENREWKTAYRGLLGIHAAKSSRFLGREELRYYPTGCIIAVAKIVDCSGLSVIESYYRKYPDAVFAGTQITYRDVVESEYTKGPFCLILDNITEIAKVYCSGKQGIWAYRHG